MRYVRTENGQLQIFVEDGETERDVLRAIVKASYETAIAIRMGLIHYDPNDILTDEDADRVIAASRGTLVVDVEYLRGRQVMTHLYRDKGGALVLNESEFRRGRGATPDVMLERAKELLEGAEPRGHMPSYGFLFKGENLDLFVDELGFKRNPGEDDWAFRKRIFPDMWQKDKDHAVMVLFGGYPLTDFIDIDTILAMDLAGNPQTPESLRKFAEGWSIDPLKNREQVAAMQ